MIDLTGDSPVASPQKKSRSAKQSSGEGIPERRARVFRRKAPQTFLQRLNRATTQRCVVNPDNMSIPSLIVDVFPP